ncbi:phage regulatory CII family protein [Acinetobacter sp.]|uniref:phage regulatory CII family protein n=1 Tax=Acinetobacter sp. TaxID=472 RepID=UPI003BAFFC63
MDISKETKTALHKMVHQSNGITPKEIADLVGVSHNTILNYANPNMENHLPSLKAFEAMLTYTQNPASLKVWAHKLGFMLVPADQAEDKDHQLGVLESLLGMNISNGEANKLVLNALEDGVVTPAEMDDIDQTLEKMEQKIQSLRKAMKGECAKYLSALQREKA